MTERCKGDVEAVRDRVGCDRTALDGGGSDWEPTVFEIVLRSDVQRRAARCGISAVAFLRRYGVER